MARREHQLPNVLRQNGPRPYWYIRYRVRLLNRKTNSYERKEKWQRLGYCNAMTLSEAKRARDQIMVQVNGQVYTLKNQIPFRDFVAIYRRDHLSALAPGGRKRDESLLDTHILPILGNERLCDIGTQQVQQLVNQKRDQGLSWWTRKAVRSVISSIYAKAEDWGYWTGKNPARKVGLGPKQPKREKRILTDDQIRQLLAELPEDERLMIETAVSTGMRVSEIAGLRWPYVDLERGVAIIQERYYRGDTAEPKTEGSKRDVPLGLLTPAFKALRSKAPNPNGYVFEWNGRPLDDRAILRSSIRPTAKRLGFHFEGFGWHSFRRQNLTLIQEEGATPFEAMAQAGHGRTAMTREYTVIDVARRAEAVIKVQRRLFGDRGQAHQVGPGSVLSGNCVESERGVDCASY